MSQDSRKWFVYDNTSYYPSATIVEADTADEAVAVYKEQTHETGFHGLAVFPLDALALWECGYETDSGIEDVLDDA